MQDLVVIPFCAAAILVVCCGSWLLAAFCPFNLLLRLLSLMVIAAAVLILLLSLLVCLLIQSSPSPPALRVQRSLPHLQLHVYMNHIMEVSLHNPIYPHTSPHLHSNEQTKERGASASSASACCQRSAPRGRQTVVPTLRFHRMYKVKSFKSVTRRHYMDVIGVIYGFV